MRDRELIRDGSVCDGDFTSDEKTVADIIANGGHESCRFLVNGNCPVVVSRAAGPYCIPRSSLEIARYVIKDRTTVERELDDFNRMAPFPPLGFFDPTKENPEDATTDRTEIRARMSEWASHILGIKEKDADSHIIEFRTPASNSLVERYSVLFDSVYDGGKSVWVHGCGSILAAGEVVHQVRYKDMPLAGSGNVQVETVPYCSSCQEAPDKNGEDVYVEDVDKREADILRRMLENYRR